MTMCLLNAVLAKAPGRANRPGRRAAVLAAMSVLVAGMASAATPACPGGALWCDALAQETPAWRMADGSAAPRPAADGTRSLTLPAGATALLPQDATLRAPAERYLEARVRAAVTAGAAARHGVVMVAYTDPRNWLGAAINLSAGSPRMTVDLVQMRDGQLTRLRQLGHDAAPSSSFQTLRVELAHGELAAWLDGERIAATLPAPLPAAVPAALGLLAQDGALEFSDVRVGAAGARAGRVALARMIARVGLQAGDRARYPVSAIGGDGGALAVTAASSDASVAQAAIDGDALLITALRAGSATIRLASHDDANVGSAIAVDIGPAFAATGASLPARVLPAAGATGVPVDTLLRIGLDGTPVLGRSGSVRIYRASDHALVDTIRLGDEVDAIGGAGQAIERVVRVKPIRIEGRELVIHPHAARLAYDTGYLVAVDGALLGNAGIGEAAGWRFRTRAAAPTGSAFTVGADGKADFRTVQGALNHVMTLPRAQPASIRVANGRYDELLYLRGKDNVTLTGESRDGVVIAAFNDDGTNPGSGSGQAADSPAATGGRAVFLVEDADLFTIETLTLANTAVRATSLGSQAEALNFNSERRLVARDASFLSEQDTIQVKGYAWFDHTLVAGNVDFIWGGNHAALFEDSEIRTVGDSAHAESGGYVVQARTLDARDPGFVFLRSRLTHGPGPAGNDVPRASTWLARPGTATSWDKVVYIDCRMDEHVAPAGWSLPKTAAANPRTGSGWAESGSMDLQGRSLDLSRRRGGHLLTPAQAAAYASRARVFSNFDNGKGWDPLPAKSKQ